MEEEGNGRILKPQITVGAAAKKSTKKARSSAECAPCRLMVPFSVLEWRFGGGERDEMELLLRVCGKEVDGRGGQPLSLIHI